MQASNPNLEVCPVSDDETEETEGEGGKEEVGKAKRVDDNEETEEVVDLARGAKKARKRIVEEEEEDEDEDIFAPMVSACKVTHSTYVQINTYS